MSNRQPFWFTFWPRNLYNTKPEGTAKRRAEREKVLKNQVKYKQWKDGEERDCLADIKRQLAKGWQTSGKV